MVAVLLLAHHVSAAAGLEQELNRLESALRLYRVAPPVVTNRVIHLSQRTGDDRRSVEEAGDSSTPWKSLERLNRLALLPGDVVLLRVGDTFPGTLVLECRATAERPIEVGAYGSGAAPLLTGRQLVFGWMADKKVGVWRAPWPGKMPTGLWASGGTHLTRFPRMGWLHLDSVLAPDRFRGSMIPGDLRGGIVCIRFVPWSFAYQKIQDSNSGRLLLDAIPEYPNLPGLPPRRMLKGNPYFVLNIPGMVEDAGDWAWDKKRRELVFASSTPPRNVAADILDCGISIRNSEHLRVSGLACLGYRESGVDVFGSQHVVLEGLDLDSTGNLGIAVKSSEDVRIRYGRIAHARDKGLNLVGEAIVVDSVRIEKIGLDPSVLLPFMEDTSRTNSRNITMGNGIVSFASDALLRGNAVSDVGYNGIFFSGRNHRVEGNVVANFCQTLDDGGAIYTGGKGSTGSVIRRNSVGYLRTPYRKGWTHGIYLDDLSEGYVVDSNRIWNVQLGVMLHNARENRVIGNKIFDPWRAGIYFQEDKTFADYSKDNITTGNSIDFSATTQAGIWIANQHPLHSVGRFANNTVVEPPPSAGVSGHAVFLGDRFVGMEQLEHIGEANK